MLSSTALDSEWARLDAFEGDGHQRVLAPVELSSGEVVDASLYVDSALTH